MGRHCITAAGRQRGAILVVALMFLIAITLLTLSSMRAANIGLYMAGSTPVYGMQGFTACTAGETDCDRYDLPAGDPVLEAAVASDHISARVERVGPIFRPPPRVVESSIDKFTSAGFRVTTTYDRMDEGLGRQQVSQGVLVLVPKQ